MYLHGPPLSLPSSSGRRVWAQVHCRGGHNHRPGQVRQAGARPKEVRVEAVFNSFVVVTQVAKKREREREREKKKTVSRKFYE